MTWTAYLHSVVATCAIGLCACDTPPDCAELQDKQQIQLPHLPCVLLDDETPHPNFSFAFSGTIADVAVVPLVGPGCNGDILVPDTKLTLTNEDGTWTMFVDFELDVEVGDPIHMERVTGPDTASAFGTRDSFTMRDGDGLLLLWEGTWISPVHPNMPAEVSTLVPDRGFGHCMNSCDGHEKWRGYSITLDGIEGVVPFAQRVTLGDFEVLGGAKLDLTCDHGIIDSVPDLHSLSVARVK